MAGSALSPHLASLHISFQIAGRPTASRRNPLGLSAPAVRVLSWRRFADFRCEVSLVPARRIGAEPRRQNALREKASPPLPAERQVRAQYDSSPESYRGKNKNRSFLGGVANLWSSSFSGCQVAKSGSLGAQPLKDLDHQPEISSGLDAVRSGNVVSEWNLDGGSDVVPVAEMGPVSMVYENTKGNVLRGEAYDDRIASRGGNAEVEGCGGGVEKVMISRASAMSRELESSLFQLFEAKDPLVEEAKFSVVQRNEPYLKGIAWSGFAALCAVFIVFMVSKLVWKDDNKHRNMFDMLRSGMTEDELGKGDIKVLKSVKNFPGDLLGRPRLDRFTLMNNIKRARQSRELFTLRNYYGAIVTEIKRMVTNVHVLQELILEQINTKRTNSVFFLCPVAPTIQEVSTSHDLLSVYVNDELDSNELPDISICSNIIEENVESADLKNGAQVMDISVKEQIIVGDVELPKLMSTTSDMKTDAKDVTSMIHRAEQIGSPDEHDVSHHNSISMPSSEFEIERQFADVAVVNLDDILGIKSFVPFGSDRQMICTKDNEQQFNSNVVSEIADDLSSDCSNITPPELKNKEIPPDTSGSDLNYFQQIEAPGTFANDAQTVQHEEFSHAISMIGEEVFLNQAMADILTKESPQRIREELVDVMRDNVQPMQDLEPSSSTWDDKQIIHANEKNPNRGRNETQAGLEIDNTGTIDSTSSVNVLQESEHQSAKKPRKNTSYNKEIEEYLTEKKTKIHQEVFSDKEAQTEQKVQGVPGISTEDGPSNGVCRTKRVAQKRLKKISSGKGVKVPAEDIVRSNMVNKKSSRQNVKRTRKNLKNALCNEGAQTRDGILETPLMINSPDDAPRAENMKPFGVSGWSAEMQSPKFPDTFSKVQSNGFSIGTTSRVESEHSQTLESVEAAAAKIETNKSGAEVIHERTTDFDKSKLGDTTTKKMTEKVIV